ncbi:MAG: hypothetical protein R6U96_03810 [Promethearchaeia archaeon]
MMEKKRMAGIIITLIGIISLISSIVFGKEMMDVIVLLLIIASIAAIVVGIILIAKGGALVNVDYSAAEGEEKRIEGIMEDIDEDNELIE